MPTGFGIVEGLKVVSCLPGHEYASIPVAKLRDYALNPESEEGVHKAVVFASALAIEREHWGYLGEQIQEGLHESPAIVHGETEYGPTWEVPILVTGRNGLVCLVRTGWIIRLKDPGPQLTTTRVAKRREIPRLRAVREAFGYATG